MRETTYGIEAEWQVGAQTLIARLHSMELAAMSDLHPYHCDCDTCALFNGYPFRGQTDSSCSGEIITDVLGTSPYCEIARGYSTQAIVHELCKAAVDVDAEPGLTSGLHVHVSVEGLPRHTLQDATWEFLRWEPVLQHAAGGRWTTQRTGMNESARFQVSAYIGQPLITTSRLEETGDELRAARKVEWHCALACSDRHGNLNIRGAHYPTWEFRLWNSTRAAWRMEMFVGLSRAFLDPDVLERLASAPVPLRLRRPSTGFQNLAECIAAEGYGDTAESLMRQGDYLDNRAGLAPSALTIV